MYLEAGGLTDLGLVSCCSLLSVLSSTLIEFIFASSFKLLLTAF